MSISESVRALLGAVPQMTDAEWAAHDARIKAEDAAAARQQCALHRREALAQVPLRDEDVRAIVRGELDDTKALTQARAWLADRASRPWLILCGGVGTGKTLAAAAVLADATGGVFCRAPELARRLEPWTGERNDDRIRTTAPLFVLDDLGAERESADPRFAAALFQLADERQSRRTIVTSNLRRNAFRGRYDPRVIDRLNACAKVVEIRGESLRRGGAGL